MQSKPQTPNPKIPYSLILTVRNEAGNIARLLDSIAAQSCLPDEVVITDGGSTDGTQEIVRSYADRLPLRLIAVPGANISQGRNGAIQNAKHATILVTDAGVRLDSGWARALLESFEAGAAVDVVCGFFLPDALTTFEAAMGATVLPSLEEIKPESFLPSSRSVAFRKEAWVEAGGYPEWLDYCEDLVFDLQLKRLGCRFSFAPHATVHFKPRSNLRAFYLQYYRYARGDGKADLWRKRHAVRYATYLLGPVLVLWAWRHRSTLTGKLLLATSLVSAAGYCRRPYLRLLPLLRRMSLQSRLYALALVPVIRLTGDIAKMAGYPVGVVWRFMWRGKSRQ